MTNYSTERKLLFEENPDLRAYQRKKLIVFCFKLLLLEAIVILLSVYLMSYTESAIALGVCFAVALPWWILKPQIVFGRSCIGTIKEVVSVSRRVTRDKGFAVFYTDTHSRTFIVCRVVTPQNRELEFEFSDQYENVYHKGDTVIKLPAVPYPINLTEHDWGLCPFCGNIMPKENDCCVECNANSIKRSKSL